MQFFNKTRTFGKVTEVLPIPNLMALQVDSYQRFLQEDVTPRERLDIGLESILREVFPIESYDSQLALEYLEYELGKPRYTPDECRKLRLTYGTPFKIRVRLRRPTDSIEEDVYLGEIPRMIGGGEFIINGAERVIVSQLHRSPGVDFDQIGQIDDGRVAAERAHGNVGFNHGDLLTSSRRIATRWIPV